MRYLAMMLLALVLLPVAARAQQPIELHWEQYDTIAEIQRDGSVRVREQQVLVVDRGTLRRMSRSFETGSAGRITNIRVFEDGQAYQRGSDQPGTYSGSDNGNQAEIQLFFRDPFINRHTITLEYTINDTLLAQNNQATFNWNFFWSSANAPEIRNGSVEVRFPESVSSNELRLAAGGVPVRQTSTNTSVRWELERPIQGQELAVEATFPQTVLAQNAQFRAERAPVNARPNAPAPLNPAPATGSGFGNIIFCMIVLLFLFIAFSIIRASAGTRRVGGYPPAPPTYGPNPYGRSFPRGRRRRGGGFGGFGFPPIIIPPPSTPNRPSDSPFDDSSSGGSGSSWGDSGGSSSSWGDMGGGGSSWGGGGSSGGGGSRGGGGNSGGGGSGGGSFG